MYSSYYGLNTFGYNSKRNIPSSNGKLIVHKRKRLNFNYKPYYPFRNWLHGHLFPYICFLECFIMVIYFFIGLVHQRSESNFTIDFTKAVDDFFLNNGDFGDPPELSNSWSGKIYFKKQFLDISNTTAYKFFEITKVLPTKFPFTSVGNLQAEILTIGGGTLITEYTEENVSKFSDITKSLITVFSQITLSMKYNIEEIIEDNSRDIKLTIFGQFTRDTDSDQVNLDFFHTSEPISEQFRFRDIWSKNQTILPLAVSICSSIVVILTISNLYTSYRFALEKEKKNYDIKSKFWMKYDKWSFFSLFVNCINIISNIYFMIYGRKYVESLPPSVVLLSISSSLHCFLLIRYLHQKPSTMLIVNSIFNAGKTLIGFLIGCMVIFAGYLVLGCCLFGSSSSNFSTFTQGSVFLIAVVHGDSIQDLYDSITIRSDVSFYYGFIYMSIWVFFSLTIMFNISISIFEESLTKEINSQKKKDKNEKYEFNSTPLIGYHH